MDCPSKSLVEKCSKKLGMSTDSTGKFLLVYWEDKTFGVIREDDIIKKNAVDKNSDYEMGMAKFDGKEFGAAFIFRGTNEEELYKLAKSVDVAHRRFKNTTPKDSKRKPKRKILDDFESDDQAENGSSVTNSASSSKTTDDGKKEKRPVGNKKTKEELLNEKKKKEASRVATLANAQSYILKDLTAEPNNNNIENINRNELDETNTKNQNTNIHNKENNDMLQDDDSSLIDVTTIPSPEPQSNQHAVVSNTFEQINNLATPTPILPLFSSPSSLHASCADDSSRNEQINKHAPACSDSPAFFNSPYSSYSQQSYHRHAEMNSPQTNKLAPLNLDSSAFFSSPYSHKSFPMHADVNSPLRPHFLSPQHNAFAAQYPSFRHQLSSYNTENMAQNTSLPNMSLPSQLKDGMAITDGHLSCSDCILKDSQIQSLTAANEASAADVNVLHRRIRELEQQVADLEETHERLASVEARGNDNTFADTVVRHYTPARGPAVELASYQFIPTSEVPPADLKRLAEGEEICVPTSWLTKVLCICKGHGSSFLMKKIIDGLFEPEDLAPHSARYLTENNKIIKAVQLYMYNETKMKHSKFTGELNSKLYSYRRTTDKTKKKPKVTTPSNTAD